MPPKTKLPIERFMTKFVVAPSGCWEWTAAMHGGGYGIFGVGTKPSGGMGMALAHRFSYQQFVGEIPEGLEIDHLCRNRKCVNPAHLEAVTRQENQLRGYSVSGRAARRTECPSGHAYDEANTYRARDGSRKCRECNRETSRQAQKRRAARLRAAATGEKIPEWAKLRT